jgi:integrase
VRPKTLVNIEGRLRKHVLPVFGRHAIAAITTGDVRDWVAALVRDKGLAADTVKAIFLTASQVFDTAEVDRVIGRSPCIAMRRKLPRPKARAEMLFLDVDQVEALVEAVEPRYRTLLLMAAYTGARAGELEALRTDRINWLRRRNHVVESLSEVRGHRAFGPTKTFETRWVPMPDFVADAVREHVDAYPSPERLVFTSTDGTPLRHPELHAPPLPAVVRAAMPAQLRFHDLRHTAAALLIAEGATMEQVKQILGHSTIRVTSDTYGHLFDDHADPLMEALAVRRGRTGVPNVCPSPVVDLAETRVSAGRNRR